jgi:lysophospholipase L1-like esterase
MRKVLVLAILLSIVTTEAIGQKKLISYLALGDSYTIGESVPSAENFPNQLAAMIRKKGIEVKGPDIVAKTGWTTDELMKGIDAATLQPRYDYVTLLIGVNNQYRGRSVDEYAQQFEFLLMRAIKFAGGDTSKVIVVSIPDWGATPFARDKGKDRAKVTEEINAFNAENNRIAYRYKVKYVDITPGTREAMINPELLTNDQLHPSGIEYKRWAEAVLKVMGL